MVKTYFRVFLDVNNPDGDELGFECDDEKMTEAILNLLTLKCKSVNPE